MATPGTVGESHRTGGIARAMGEDKYKVNRQRNIHLSGDCGNAADMERDLLYVISLLWFVEERPE